MGALDRKLIVILLVVFFGFVVLAGLGYSASAALGPVITGIIGLSCVIPELLAEFRKPADPAQESWHGETAAQERMVLAWVCGLLLLTLLLGLLVAAVLFVFLYTWRVQRLALPLALLLAAGIGVFFYGVFDRLMEITLHQGWLARLWL